MKIKKQPSSESLAEFKGEGLFFGFWRLSLEIDFSFCQSRIWSFWHKTIRVQALVIQIDDQNSARISKDMGWDISGTMSSYSAHLTTEERKYWEWNDEFFLKCVGFYIGMYFMLEGEILFARGNQLLVHFYQDHQSQCLYFVVLSITVISEKSFATPRKPSATPKWVATHRLRTTGI